MRIQTALTMLMMCGVLAAAGPKEEIQARYAEVSAAVAAGDLTRLAAIYVEDATFKLRTPTGQDQVRGSESIAGLWRSPIGGGATSFDVTIDSVDAKGDAVAEKGRFVMKKKDGSVFARGTYSASWRRDAKVWKLVSHDLLVEK